MEHKKSRLIISIFTALLLALSCCLSACGVTLGGISFQRESVQMTVGEQLCLLSEVEISPAGASAELEWSASDDGISVDGAGNVIALREGNFTLTVTAKGTAFSAACQIQVVGEQTPTDPSEPSDPTEPTDPADPVIPEYVMQEGVDYSNNIGFAESGEYDEKIFRYNAPKDFLGADPFALKITDPESEYYNQYVVYGTISGFVTYTSRDLVSLEYQGPSFKPNSKSWAVDYLWAPEVTYDSDTGLYYLFYSGRNKRAQEAGVNSTQKWWVSINVAVSESPVGQFMEYQEYEVRQANPTLSEEELKPLIQEAVKYPRYSWEQLLANDPARTSSQDYFTSIDPSPFVDPVTQKKYLLFTRDRVNGSSHTWVYMMEMEDWATPKYETLTRITSVDDAGYEEQGNTINEGAQLIYNAQLQKYYLTFSVNSYESATYCVGQAIADSVMGPYEKIKIDKGGAFLYSLDTEGTVSGAGHHAMFEEDGKMYAIYHRHVNATGGVNPLREYAIDEVVWVTNPDGVTILHCNGPTTTLVPNIISDYQNIAGDATVTTKVVNGKTGEQTEGLNASSLTDGAFVAHAYPSAADYGWVQEFSMGVSEIGSTAEITVTFEDWRTVGGLSILNSRYNTQNAGYHAFSSIKKIVIQARVDGEEKTLVINDLAVDENFLVDKNGLSTMLPGSGAYVSFADIEVKSIQITVEDRWGDCIGIQEIQIIGKE